MESDPPKAPLRRGWTTGACAAASAKAAFAALITGEFPDPVYILLPGGQRPSFALAKTELGEDSAFAAIVKDAGDDPDVTHGALVCARVRRGPAGSGIRFRAGPGVGTVTRPGLPLPVGEPAINPKPREIIGAAIHEISNAADIDIEISIPGGEKLAKKTLNPRLGIIGGLSILGTTGIVIPYSCSAWIHSIHRGIDVARASGIEHIAAATGSTSESAIQQLYGLSEVALIDMGDFAGGMLKYLRRHPVPRLSLAGGFAKMSKLAEGRLDLHSKSGSVNLEFLAELAKSAHLPSQVIDRIIHTNTAKHALDIAHTYAPQLAAAVAAHAWKTAAKALEGSEVALEIVVFDREGRLLARI